MVRIDYGLLMIQARWSSMDEKDDQARMKRMMQGLVSKE